MASPEKDRDDITVEPIPSTQTTYKVPTNTTLAWRFGLELVSVSIVGIIVLVPYIFKGYVFSKPQRRGFFCDDEDIKHHHLEETIRFNLFFYIIFGKIISNTSFIYLFLMKNN